MGGSPPPFPPIPSFPHQGGRGGPNRLRSVTTSALTAGLVLFLDQLTKSLIKPYLAEFDGGSVPVVGDAIKLTYVLNRGAAFGVLQNQNVFFIIVSGVVIAVIIGSYRYSAMRSPLVNFALGLQLGGALGNLADRLRLGYVVDFIELPMWPVFNVADSAICVGVALLAYHLLRSPERSPRPT